MSSAFRRALRHDGYAVVTGPLDREAFLALGRQLGGLLAEETIALRPGAHAYVAKPGPVPLHTDHPEVDVVAWLCEVQDDADGASRLLDTRPLVDSLAADERELLRRVHLAYPPLAGGPPTGRWPVLRPTGDGDAVFCSPWLRAVDAPPHHAAALDRFRESISRRASTAVVDIRLVPGDALFVDNRRVLHGRRAIAEASPRRLLRSWLRCHAAAPATIAPPSTAPPRPTREADVPADLGHT